MSDPRASPLDLRETRYSRPRDDIVRPDQERQHSTKGSLTSIGTLNQFHPLWDDLIAEYKTPRSICGYLSLANACVLSRVLKAKQGRVSKQEVLEALSDVQTVLAEVKKSMAFIQSSREAYIQNHIESFTTERERNSYMRNWVANYEISQYIRSRTDVNLPLLFLRFNEWPERASATHEELALLEAEQQIFGGKEGDKASASSFDFARGDSMFIVEQFNDLADAVHPLPRGSPCLLNPKVFREVRGATKRPLIVLLDLNGHFAIGLRDPDPDFLEPNFLMLNTTSSDYLRMSEGSALMAAFAFDLLCL